jgi:hypothetical protein
MPGPGHRFKACFADRLAAFFTGAKTPLSNPGHDILNGPQKLPVCLIHTNLHGGACFTGSHID